MRLAVESLGAWMMCDYFLNDAGGGKISIPPGKEFLQTKEDRDKFYADLEAALQVPITEDHSSCAHE